MMMVLSCTLFAILFIVRVSHGQLQECPSCCNHTFTEESIKTAGNPQAFWDCNESEEFVIYAGRCFSECAYNLPPPQFTLDYLPWPVINVQHLNGPQRGQLVRCFTNCLRTFDPGYCNNCNDTECEELCSDFGDLLNDTMSVNEPLPPVHSAFYTSSNGGYNLHVEPRDTHYVADDTMDESQDQMNVQNLTYGFIIKLHSPNTNKTSYCPLVENFFGTFIRDIGHLCTPTQMSYAVVNRYGISDYSPVNIECLGNYNNEDILQLSDIQTCVSKDLRPGFEGHYIAEIFWTPHLAHEPHCVGEYIIDITPEGVQTDTNCNNDELIITTTTVDKHATSHQFHSIDREIKLFKLNCSYSVTIFSKRLGVIPLGREEFVVDDKTKIGDIALLRDIRTCVSKDLRPGFEGHDVVEISWKLHLIHESYCVGGYIVDIIPDSKDSDCKHDEVVNASVTVDKHTTSHQFQSSDTEFKLFKLNCTYAVSIHGKNAPEMSIGRKEFVIDDKKERRALCCSFTNITGQVKYNKTQKSTTLTFFSDDVRATYKCKLDKRKFKKCKSPVVWKNLRKRRHTVIVKSRCFNDNSSEVRRKEFTFRVR